ncbi:hypothetical protein ACHAPT_013178 [Fusarium lateritium]
MSESSQHFLQENTGPLLQSVVPAGNLNYSLWKLHRRLAWLKHVGALGVKELRLGHDGLPCFDGMPLEHGDFPVPPLILTEAPIQAPPGFANYPAVSSARLRRMVHALKLKVRGKLAHMAWRRALAKLENLRLLPEAPSAFIPLAILNVAKKACIEDHKTFEDFVYRATEDDMLLLDQKRPASGWSAHYMARMIGLEADGGDDREWWVSSGTRALVEDLDERAYICIHRTWRLLDRGYDMCYKKGNLKKAQELTSIALEHMQDFIIHFRPNQVLAQVENAIEELQKHIRDKGLGGYLCQCR